MNTPEDFEKLEIALNNALCVCPPDEYQSRQNKLCHIIAEHLLNGIRTKRDPQQPLKSMFGAKGTFLDYRNEK